MRTTPWQTVSAVQLYEIESKQRSGIALKREQYIKHKVPCKQVFGLALRCRVHPCELKLYTDNHRALHAKSLAPANLQPVLKPTQYETTSYDNPHFQSSHLCFRFVLLYSYICPFPLLCWSLCAFYVCPSCVIVHVLVCP